MKSASGRLNVTAAASKSADKASSPFFAADILIYYERAARANSEDRELIIRMGFQEWLLAAVKSRAESDAASIRNGVRAPFTERQQPNMIILIANLIGGVKNG